MFWAVIVFLLLNVSISDSKYSENYPIIPPLPPKAFVGEYYTCDFRAQGLINPIYKFTNLPPFLKSLQNGRIQGIPTMRGTYKFTISYFQSKKLGQTQIILSVGNPQVVIFAQNASQKQSLTQITDKSAQPPRLYPQFPTVYDVGDDIFLNLPRIFSLSTRIWSYLSLPKQLIGQDNGYISGSFIIQGMYSFAAVYSDPNGKTKSFIITLNIQPTYYYDFWGGYDLETVPARNLCKCQEKTFKTWKMAVSLLQQTQKAVNTIQEKIKWYKDFLAKQAVLITMTQNTLKTQTKVKQLTFAKQCELVKIQQSTKSVLSKGKDNYDLAVTNYNNTKCNLQKLTQKLSQAEQNFNKSKTVLQAANKVFIEAQSASSEVASLIAGLQVKIAGYKDDIQPLFSVVASAKQTLLIYQNILTNNSFASSNAHNAKQIANMENDIALSDYRNKQAISNKTLFILKKTNENVTEIGGDLINAADLLGTAKFNLKQAINQLLVAQAAKAEADKNIAIMSSRSKKSTLEGTSTYIFGGCNKGLYPSFSGTMPVKDILKSRVLLASGHTLIYGNCSRTIQLIKGDIVNFDGYLKDGIIHALQFYK